MAIERKKVEAALSELKRLMAELELNLDCFAFEDYAEEDPRLYCNQILAQIGRLEMEMLKSEYTQ